MAVPTIISPEVKYFFNQSLVMDVMTRHERRALSRSSAYVAEVARRSIYKRNTTSKPGERPHSHTGKLRNLIRSGVDSNRVCAVAGVLTRFDVTNEGRIPNILEYGGKSKIKNNEKKYKIGDVAPIRKERGGYDFIEDNKKRRTRVTTAKLTTQKQVDRANELVKSINKTGEFEAYISARPFMNTALIQSESIISKFFQE